MNIKKNSWMLWLIRSTYGIEKWDTWKYPKSLCTFFWEFVVSLILLPVAYLTHVYNLIIEDTEFSFAPSLLLTVFGYVLSYRIVEDAFNINIVSQYGFAGSWFIFATTGAIAIVILMILIVLSWLGIKKLCGLLVDLYRLIFPAHEFASRPKEKNPSIVWEFIKAKKRKICPLIDYVE